jgi:hypothetical protein
LHAFLASYLAKAELLVEKQVLDGVAGLGLEPGEMVALHYGKFGGWSDDELVGKSSDQESIDLHVINTDQASTDSLPFRQLDPPIGQPASRTLIEFRRVW